ncbi:phosphopantetheine-binding protein [Streptococcus iners]|uniref:Acyl carrier protein n=1 Tax=Streptococcus iners TaxID=3028084 RepID=A0AA96VL16_9STRE|nr:phosphopantetheine-binding protein [Streptococcus sp. 29887]MCK4026343.1 acyl carrier protein [Streptococcus suis]WNY51133.1 phosphopantetheine-binding protein [Streptococcus sp. 29887]
MTREQVYQRVVAIIQEEKGDDFQVQSESSLADNIAADSVEIMEFVLTLEDEFGVDVPDAAIERFETLADIVDFIYEELQKRS